MKEKGDSEHVSQQILNQMNYTIQVGDEESERREYWTNIIGQETTQEQFVNNDQGRNEKVRDGNTWCRGL